MKIHIRNGRLIDRTSGLDAKRDLYIAAGYIVAWAIRRPIMAFK